MTAAEAYEMHAAMRRFGIRGAVEPVSQGDVAGAWRVVDEAGGDITAHALAEVTAARGRRPERGFVFAR
ncbi:hypothetical protein ACIBEA_11560 [Streptomyces sp. NPDC051555]|uniref:hypothetical protein n=1 Tax=Streptomyces sp. NPDC051555 TaxID=3365657 RepID=UPI00379A59B4